MFVLLQGVWRAQQENRGKQLFLAAPNNGGAGCAGCHSIPTFGLAANTAGNGLDAGETTVFKSPSLKNVALNGPYMHDGRFATLDEVIEHYSSGIQMSGTIDPLIEFASQGGVQLDAQEKDLLKKFLNTLTDYDFINNPNFKDPNE